VFAVFLFISLFVGPFFLLLSHARWWAGILMPVVHALLDLGEDASTDNLKTVIPIGLLQKYGTSAQEACFGLGQACTK